MKILFLSYDYFPAGSAEAKLLHNLLSELIRHEDCQIDLLTLKNDQYQPREEVIDGVHVFRETAAIAVSLKQSTRLSVLRRIPLYCEKMLDVISAKDKRRFLAPGPIRALYRGLKRLHAEQYDAVVPVSAYFETFAAVDRYIMRRELKPPVVQYQLDPLASNGAYLGASRKAREKLEAVISQKAAAIVTTPLLLEVKLKAGIDARGVTCCEFPSVIDLTGEDSSAGHKETRVVFAGYLHERIRNPEYTLKLFSHLPESTAQLHIIGGGYEELVESYARESSGKIVRCGVLPADRAREQVKSADFLVNIGNSDISFVPSKIFEYISTGKPVINIYKYPDCPTLEYFSHYPNALSLYEGADDFDGQLNLLKGFLLANKGKRLSYREISSEFLPCTAGYVAQKFYDILKNTIERRKQA